MVLKRILVSVYLTCLCADAELSTKRHSRVSDQCAPAQSHGSVTEDLRRLPRISSINVVVLVACRSNLRVMFCGL